MPTEAAASWERLKCLEGTLVVSCQASHGEPLDRPEHILALSLSAIAGGAGGLRLEGTENIRHVRLHTNVPIVGLLKSPDVDGDDRDCDFMSDDAGEHWYRPDPRSGPFYDFGITVFTRGLAASPEKDPRPSTWTLVKSLYR